MTPSENGAEHRSLYSLLRLVWKMFVTNGSVLLSVINRCGWRGSSIDCSFAAVSNFCLEYFTQSNHLFRRKAFLGKKKVPRCVGVKQKAASGLSCFPESAPCVERLPEATSPFSRNLGHRVPSQTLFGEFCSPRKTQ